MILTWNLDQYLNLTRETMQHRKKIDDDFMSKSCDVIVIFPIYGQFRAILKPDSERIVWKAYILVNSNLLCYKNWKQN